MMLGMLVSIIITALLLYIAFNTKFNEERLPVWTYYVIALLTLASWESAIIMLGLCIYSLYKGIKSGDVDTLPWIEDLFD